MSEPWHTVQYKKWLKRNDAALQKMRLEQAEEERKEKESAIGASAPAAPESDMVSTKNLRIINGRLVPFEAPIPNKKATELAALMEAAYRARQGKR